MLQPRSWGGSGIYSRGGAMDLAAGVPQDLGGRRAHQAARPDSLLAGPGGGSLQLKPAAASVQLPIGNSGQLGACYRSSPSSAIADPARSSSPPRRHRIAASPTRAAQVSPAPPPWWDANGSTAAISLGRRCPIAATTPLPVPATVGFCGEASSPSTPRGRLCRGPCQRGSSPVPPPSWAGKVSVTPPRLDPAELMGPQVWTSAADWEERQKVSLASWAGLKAPPPSRPRAASPSPCRMRYEAEVPQPLQHRFPPLQQYLEGLSTAPAEQPSPCGGEAFGPANGYLREATPPPNCRPRLAAGGQAVALTALPSLRAQSPPPRAYASAEPSSTPSRPSRGGNLIVADGTPFHAQEMQLLQQQNDSLARQIQESNGCCKPTVALDVDEVLVCYVDGFRKFLQRECPNGPMDPQSVFLEAHNQNSPLRNQFANSGGLDNLEAVPGAAAALQRLRAAGIRLEVVTSRPPVMRQSTEALLLRLFPPDTFSAAHFVGPGEKGLTCNAIHALALVDDQIPNAIDADACGVISVLFDLHGSYPWSACRPQELPAGVRRIESWSATCDYLLAALNIPSDASPGEWCAPSQHCESAQQPAVSQEWVTRGECVGPTAVAAIAANVSGANFDGSPEFEFITSNMDMDLPPLSRQQGLDYRFLESRTAPSIAWDRSGPRSLVMPDSTSMALRRDLLGEEVAREITREEATRRTQGAPMFGISPAPIEESLPVEEDSVLGCTVV
mmetsp:Transcript_53976/g.122037  ORF Transcript_53976/g.122037 Transcript_53976/m.122037 type:complete len:730 (+) Transcript_53976:99-2288(+)